jgi:uncharacterized protein involved in type VI secretion and phage assembly
MRPTFTSIPSVRLGGRTLTGLLAEALTGCEVDSTLSMPSAFELTFADHDGQLAGRNSLEVGMTVEIRPVADGRPGEPIITGEVTALAREQDRARQRRLILRGYDLGHRLTRRRQVQGYPKKTAADIVRQIAREHGVPVGTVDRTPTVYDLATQANTTDWEFLGRLAAENGVYLYVDRAGKLQFTEERAASGAPSGSRGSTNPLVLSLNESQMQDCRIDVTSAALVRRVEARGWDVTAKRKLAGQASATASPAAAIGIGTTSLGGRLTPTELTEASRPFTTNAQVRNVAKAIAEDVGNSMAEVDAAIDGTPELDPGTPVALTDAGKPFDGKYTVSAVRHRFAPGERYTTELEVSGRQARTLYGLATGAVTTPAVTPGVVTALVDDVKDPQRQGRVKLRFPWLSDTYVSDWCRVAQFGGVSGGGLNLPDYGDEVLVAFDRGALEAPYVIAGLYNGRDRVPTVRDGAPPYPAQPNGRMAWRTLASRSDHRLELHDGPTVRGLRMRTGDGGQSVRLDQTTRSVTVASTTQVDLKAGAVTGTAPCEITLSPTGTTIRGPVRIEGPVTVLGEVNVTGATSIEGETNVAGAFTTEGEVNHTGVLTQEGEVNITGLLTVEGGAVVDLIPFPPL